MRARLLPVAPVGVLLLAIVGCGYPVADPVNMEIITSLRTACSAGNPEWLTQNEDKIEQRHAAGQMRDDEYAAFNAIIQKARGGDWAGAERDCLKFQKAQRPTHEDREKARAYHEK